MSANSEGIGSADPKWKSVAAGSHTVNAEYPLYLSAPRQVGFYGVGLILLRDLGVFVG